MIQALQEILTRAGETLWEQIVIFVPALLAALVILGVAWAIAWTVRWASLRLFKVAALDHFLADSGLRSMMGRAGRAPGARLVASGLYVLILLGGILTALNVFNTRLTGQMVDGVVRLFPRLLTAAAILLAGFWVARFLGRETLVWASNEELPHPRRWAAAVRIGVAFVAVVAGAELLDFAPQVFLTAFIIAGGGAALAASLALGLGTRDAVRQALTERQAKAEEEKVLFNHL